MRVAAWFVVACAGMALIACGDSSGEGSGSALCSNTCDFPRDGECDDGGDGSVTTLCSFGTDCDDCGARQSQGSAGGASCQWNGNCSTVAPPGSYDCLGDDNTLVTCIDGSWEVVADCSGFFSGSDRCSCKGGCGTETVECSFAFDICGSQQYPTTP
ncbi:MAG: hypothetical protein AAF500_06785 [Myxococcota bacterium]